jgi:alpha-beta hydrolase superfamily lysophospholipase
VRAETTTFTTPDGIPVLVRTFDPDGPPRGIVQILHGLAEHSARYARIAEALAGAGWAVITHDHRGHGGSVRDERDRGHFADTDGFTKAVIDVGTVTALARTRWPGVPLVLFGHSMGSTIAVHHVFRDPTSIDALILSGPTGLVGPIRRLGLLITRLERLRLGRRGRSRLLHAMSFGDFNKAFEPARTEYDWLSRDPTEVDRYANDPLCGFVVTTQHWYDHLVALGQLGDPALLARFPADLPVYVFAGTRDPVSKQTRQIDPFVEKLKQAGVRRVDVRFYVDGRHEMLNDVVRDEVTRDLLDWLDDRVPVDAARPGLAARPA